MSDTRESPVPAEKSLASRAQVAFLTWLAPGMATSMAALVSTPMELVKTRLQIQGELQGANAARKYTGFGQALGLIVKEEGLPALWKGFLSAATYQFVMNGTRFAIYDPIKRAFGTNDENASFVGLRRIAAGASAGGIAAMVGSPAFLVKVRMQMYTGGASGAVGTQHAYTGPIHAVRSILKADGLSGLYRGVTAQMARVATGSAAQLSTYDTVKEYLRDTAKLPDGVALHAGSALASSFVVVTCMNPMDVVSSRIYNQPVVNGKGTLYKGPIDCLVKSVKSEGARSLFKGWVPHYFRLGPHTVLTFVFYEQLKGLFGLRRPSED